MRLQGLFKHILRSCLTEIIFIDISRSEQNPSRWQAKFREFNLTISWDSETSRSK
jgi:hypothetical protein